MLFKSQIFTQVSGSVGGLTFARNRAGMYTRARTVPVDPQTPQQIAVRANMANLVIRWGSTLTAAQRDIWETYAANTPVLDKFGDSVNITGQQMYLRSNLSRLQSPLAVVDDGPTIFNLGTFTLPTIVSTEPVVVTVTFENADDWANEDDAGMFVWQSRPQNPTVNFFKGPYRFIGGVLGDVAIPPTSPAVIGGAFAVATDQKVFYQVRVTRVDGRLSDPARQSDIVI